MRTRVVSHTSSLKPSSPTDGVAAEAPASEARNCSTIASMSSPASKASQSSRSSRARSMKFQRLSQSIAAARGEEHQLSQCARAAGIGGRLAPDAGKAW